MLSAPRLLGKQLASTLGEKLRQERPVLALRSDWRQFRQTLHSWLPKGWHLETEVIAVCSSGLGMKTVAKGRGQPVVYSEFRDRQGYIERP